ncbi:MAG: sigma factor, partial [Sciscionella sp.]
MPLAPAAEIDDATLVARARDGDMRAFELLVSRFQRRIYALAVRMLGSAAEAEDVVQDVFITAWRRLPEIR